MKKFALSVCAILFIAGCATSHQTHMHHEMNATNASCGCKKGHHHHHMHEAMIPIPNDATHKDVKAGTPIPNDATHKNLKAMPHDKNHAHIKPGQKMPCDMAHQNAGLCTVK
ncbi:MULTISPECIES: hypothetical protein [unclassified Campylobacter]|uniref:hypothetical protein n=1 Tax=unclassified Campylobacter TaxID=2593542 RepID=UPI003D32A7BB